MDISLLKKELRGQMLSKRNSMEAGYRDYYNIKICQALDILVTQRQFKSIHTYLPMHNEVDIYPLIKKWLNRNMTIICPKTMGSRKLEHRILHSLNALEGGIKGTRHPAERDIFLGESELIIVPGLAFDKYNFRLGYGGGYYDGFLAEMKKVLKVGVFYPFQEVPEVPVELHDIRLDLIITGSQTDDNPV